MSDRGILLSFLILRYLRTKKANKFMHTALQTALDKSH